MIYLIAQLVSMTGCLRQETDVIDAIGYRLQGTHMTPGDF